MSYTRPAHILRTLAVTVGLPLAAFGLTLVLFVPSLGAKEAAEPEAKPWTIDDLVLAESARGFTVDRGGDRTAWELSSVAKIEGEEKRVSHLWLADLEPENGEIELLQLTRGPHRDHAPTFSPDGRRLAFLSSRDLPPGGAKVPKGARPQLWILPLAGGEPYPVTRFDRGIRDYDWIDDETVVVLAQESPTARESRLDKKAKDTSIVVDDAVNEPPVRLFRVTLDGAAERLTESDDWQSSLAVSPDGSHAVVTAAQSLSYQFDSKIPPHTFLVDLESGERERILKDTDLLPFGVRWRPDSAGFYFINDFTRHPKYRMATIRELYRYDVAAGEAKKIELGTDRGVGGGYVPLGDGVLVLLADGVRYRPARYTEGGDGWKREALDGPHVENIDDLVSAATGKGLVYLTSAVDRPDAWYTARLDGARLVDEHLLVEPTAKRYAGKKFGRSEVLRWTGALGEEVEGILQYPLDWDDENPRPAPLILDIHGGPLGTDRDTWGESWASPNILWRKRGAFVLQVNYHGSGGYGLDWAESIEKRYYELEIPDIEAGVDHVIELGLADPDRLASTGWSNGGILTAELITRTTRYKAAVVGAADVEWASDWANVDFGASFDNYYFGATPWEAPQVYLDKSPFYRLTEVETPTIVHTGTEDRNVPPHQSWSLFRALQYLEKTPVRLVLYPGEPHGLRKIAHQRRKASEDLSWFDKYFFKTHKPENDALPEGSLLASLLERAGAAKVDGAWGREMKGVLVPETVARGTIEAGRFEVTRAQWSAFDERHELVPGEESLPIVGIGFERARAYADWLAETTGEPFRLPTVEEAKKLAKAAGTDGNTLDRWVGYTPNPDDAERLAEPLAKVGLEALLLPVGSLAGDGDAPLFDLDGNAAEWAIGENGEGIAVGPSAERSTDPRSDVKADPAMIGLRVVRGAAGD